MAKKVKTVFVCQECGYESPKWQGQCICGAWNSMVEEKLVDIKVKDDSRSRLFTEAQTKKTRALHLNEITSGAFDRFDTGIGELNRVLGGGLVRGSLVLISGEPGIGKSTIIIQAASNISAGYGTVLYISGEESEEQIKMRAERVCKGDNLNLLIASETNMENILMLVEKENPTFLIIDSIQTMYTETLEAAPGSVSQVRECGNALMKIGKVRNIPTFIVAHVNKNGDLAGPKIVEHLVDCVLNFSGERSSEIRILRALKNRFGTTSEIGAFEMCEDGLCEIENLSKTFLEGMDDGAQGAIATAVYEGTRPLLLEIQALTARTNTGFPRRSSIGMDLNRLNMLIAVLERKANLNLTDKDVYINIVGGIKPDSTSIDLAAVLAIYSSLKGVTCPAKMLAIGEIGLTGDLRAVRNVEKVVLEAARLGFDTVLLPQKNADLKGIENLQLIGVKDVKQAISYISKFKSL
ncbi:MAG: DNA repair protein RadA [Eubacteriales bacterium]